MVIKITSGCGQNFEAIRNGIKLKIKTLFKWRKAMKKLIIMLSLCLAVTASANVNLNTLRC
jgi:hypothetical protein